MPASREALSCFGSVWEVRGRGPGRRDAAALKAQADRSLLLVRSALFGVGDEVTHPYLYKQ